MKTVLRFLLVASLVSCVALVVQAQSSVRVLVNYAELLAFGENEPFVLNLYFNLLDGAERPLANTSLRSGIIIMDDGSRYDAALAQPNSPYFVVLTLDASGSMGGVSRQMQDAATAFVNSVPQNTSFRVIRFNDSVDESLMSSFTSDREDVINAISQVNPVSNAGTCLYDAAFRAVEILESVPAGRRAVILFTDGVDQVLSGASCSQFVSEDVINLATRTNLRVPIHTIGMRGGQPVDELGLRGLAQSTGGVSVVGTTADLAALFSSIATAMNAQWQATTSIFAIEGQRAATLLIALSDGSLTQPDAINFRVPFSVVPPAGSTQVVNVTLPPSSSRIGIESVRHDDTTETINVRIIGENIASVVEYRFDLKDRRTNLLLGEYVVSAPLAESIAIPIGNLTSGEYALTVSAVSADGLTIARSNEQAFVLALPPTAEATNVGDLITLNGVAFDAANNLLTFQLAYQNTELINAVRLELFFRQTNILVGTFTFAPESTLTIDASGFQGGGYTVVLSGQSPNGDFIGRRSADFTLVPNTPTPIVPTNTAPPIGVVVNGVRLDEDTNELVIATTLLGEQQIGGLRVTVTDARTGLQVSSFSFAPGQELRIPRDSLSGGDYRLEVIADDVNGSFLNRHNAQISLAEETPTPSPTPVRAGIVVRGAELNDSRNEVILEIEVANPSLIAAYELSLFDARSGLRVANFAVTPVNNQIRIPLTAISNGQYRIELIGRADDGSVGAEVIQVIEINLPTPVPTSDGAPSAPDEPLPTWSNERMPLIIALISVLSLMGVGLLFVLLRRRKSPKKTSAGFDSGLTDAFENLQDKGRSSGSESQRRARQRDSSDDLTNAQIVFDPEATNANIMLEPPKATLTVVASADTQRRNERIQIDRSGFVVGRDKDDHLSINDMNVSRGHIRILFRPSLGFFLVARRGNLETRIDGEVIRDESERPLRTGQEISLGQTTRLIFETGYDPDETEIHE